MGKSRRQHVQRWLLIIREKTSNAVILVLYEPVQNREIRQVFPCFTQPRKPKNPSPYTPSREAIQSRFWVLFEPVQKGCRPTTVTPIIQYGAIPVFVDITIPGYNIDVDMLEKAYSEKTAKERNSIIATLILLASVERMKE